VGVSWGNERYSFLSPIRGWAQRLPNGNTLGAFGRRGGAGGDEQAVSGVVLFDRFGDAQSRPPRPDGSARFLKGVYGTAPDSFPLRSGLGPVRLRPQVPGVETLHVFSRTSDMGRGGHRSALPCRRSVARPQDFVGPWVADQRTKGAKAVPPPAVAPSGPAGTIG